MDRKGAPITVRSLTKPLWTLELPEAAMLRAAERPGTEKPEGKQMGSTNWIELPIQGQPAALIVAGNSAVVGGQDCVLSVDLATRAVTWKADVAGAACGLAVADGRLFVSTDRGRIYCFRAGPATSTVVSGATNVTPPPPDPRYAAAAEEIVRRTGITRGFCVDVGCGDGSLALELARRTELQIFGLEADAALVATARKRLDRAGLYGTRVTIHQANLSEIPYPDYFADLVVSQRALSDGPEAVSGSDVQRLQRPHGGMACLGRSGAMSLAARGPLEGAGNWTHQNTSAANTLCSDDTRLRGPLAMLWYRDTDFVLSNRHGRGPAPLVDRGRMFVEGLSRMR